MTPPDIIAKNILDDYERHEKKMSKNTNTDKEKNIENNEDFWTGEDDKPVANSDLDDFWSGEDSSSVADFWSGEGTVNDEILVEKGLAEGTGHQFLGSQEVFGDYATISYFDHGKEDGDRVRLFLNNQIIMNNITLTKREQQMRIALKQGINKISFESLDEGSTGKNTATFKINSASGKTIFLREWNISNGFKATLLIVRK